MPTPELEAHVPVDVHSQERSPPPHDPANPHSRPNNDIPPGKGTPDHPEPAAPTPPSPTPPHPS